MSSWLLLSLVPYFTLVIRRETDSVQCLIVTEKVGESYIRCQGKIFHSEGSEVQEQDAQGSC